MKAIVWQAKNTIAIQDVPVPQAGKDEILVNVGCTGICGSDVMIISGKHPRAKTPLILGHEFMGTISALHEDKDTSLSIGQRVVVEPLLACKTCRPCKAGYEHVCESLRLLGVETDGGFAELVNVPLERVYALPDFISDEEAAIIEPLAVAVHAVDYGNPKKEDSVVILGAGPIGLLIAEVVRAAGVSRLWLCEMNPYRLEMARNLGFETVDVSKTDTVQTILELTDGHGADVTFEAAGVPATGGQIIPITGIKGRIVMTAIHKKPCEVLFQQLAYREQTILGTRIYAQGNFRKAISLVSEGKVELKPLITHTFSMEDALEAFELALRGGNFCKIVIKQSGKRYFEEEK